MAYSNYYPQNYFPYGAYAQQVQPQQNNGIIWVQGEASAKSYLVAPGNTVPLWDSENKVIYVKSADATGMPSMKVLDYTIREEVPAEGPKVHDELTELSRKVDKILEKIGGVNNE